MGLAEADEDEDAAEVWPLVRGHGPSLAKSLNSRLNGRFPAVELVNMEIVMRICVGKAS